MDSPVDPKSLNDEALTQICASAPRENALLLAGCLGSVIVLLLMFIGTVAFGSLAPRFLTISAFVVAALFLAHQLVSWPKRRYREELAYRCGDAPFSLYIEEAQTVLSQGNADWILIFTARGLPHGDFRWLELALREGPPLCGRVDLRVSESKLPGLERVESDVPDAIVQELLTFLKELNLEALTDVPDGGFDGLPCQLAVLCREPWAIAMASCNLGGLSEEWLQHPTVVACLKLNTMAYGMFSPDRRAN
jgi:hypothetical protein